MMWRQTCVVYSEGTDDDVSLLHRLLHTFSAEGCNVTDKNIGVMPGIIQGLDCVMNAPNGDVVNVIGSNPETSQLSTLISDAGLGAALRADKVVFGSIW